jgi:UDP-3-O-[3-hydroxymyristoyl] glucosamine N-acyltransferase
VKPFTLQEAAGIAGASLAGPGDLVLKRIAPLAEAGAEDLSFVSGARNAAAARTSRAAALVVSDPGHAFGRPAMVHPNPQLAIARILERLVPEALPPAGISPRAEVSSSAAIGRGVAVAAGASVADEAVLGDRVRLGPNAVVGRGAVLGEDCVIGANAVIEPGCRLGARCRVGAGAVIGSEGFGYVWDESRHVRVPQVGIVVLEDDVDVGANACIDRAALSETRIGRGSKIDNLVQIGHNVTIGEHSIVCGQTGIAGSARIGRRVTLAGQVGIADRMVVGDGAVATAQAGIMRNVEPGQVVSGMPAEPHADFLRREAAADRLPEALDRLRKVEAALDRLRETE